MSEQPRRRRADRNRIQQNPELTPPSPQEEAAPPAENPSKPDVISAEPVYAPQSVQQSAPVAEPQRPTPPPPVQMPSPRYAEPDVPVQPTPAAPQTAAAPKKNSKKALPIGAAALLAVVVLLVVLFSGSNPASTYQKAQKQLAQGKYAKAAEKFESLGSYEDAATLAMYCKACALCEEGNFEAGIAGFEALGDYKDCAMRITYYTARSWDDASVGTTEFEWMERAKNIYDDNPLYLDSTERMAALDSRIAKAKADLYNEAVANGEAGKYDKARTTFERLGSYKDSETRNKYYKARFCEMTADTDSSLKQAQELFESIPDFEDSSVRAKKLFLERLINYPDYLGSVSEGLICITKDDKYGFIDSSGNVVSEPQWDDAYSFSEGFAEVEKDGKWSLIDKLGNIVLGWK